MSGFFTKLTGQDKAVTQALPKEFRDPDDPRILYRLSDRAKRISLKVRPSDREVAVIVPSRGALAKAKSFAWENMEWINVQLEALPAPRPFVDGGQILIRGLEYTLINPSGRGRPKIDHINREVIVPSPDEESFAGRVRRLLIRDAREELEAATHHYAAMLGKRALIFGPWLIVFLMTLSPPKSGLTNMGLNFMRWVQRFKAYSSIVSTVRLLLVNTQIRSAMPIALRAKVSASFSYSSIANAAERAKFPPDPIAVIPEPVSKRSGSTTSPLPVRTKVSLASATIIMACN